MNYQLLLLVSVSSLGCYVLIWMSNEWQQYMLTLTFFCPLRGALFIIVCVVRLDEKRPVGLSAL